MTTRPSPRRSHPAIDLAVLLGLLALAAVLRLPDLATRGTWDADQGHDMLVLRAFVQDGVVPLLGPPTSIGDFHHGALYYFLLAPAALLTGGDSPLAVTFAIALAGIAAVGVTWWLGRAIAGSVAGFVAGLLMAVSSSAVEESTFIWNPNLIALSSAVALAGAWHAWTTRRARWWLLAAAGVAATMQCHVLGVTLLPIVGALLIADARRRGPGPDRQTVLAAGSAGLGIIALTYIPLAIHEATTGFAETNAALDWLRAGGEPTDQSPPVRAVVILARVVSWPLTGLLTDAPTAALLAVLLVGAIVLWRWRSRDDGERVAVRWPGLGLLWTAGFLTVAAAGLGRVVPGLPNDHYHAFADPMVFALVGIGAAAAVGAWRRATPPTGRMAPADGRRRSRVTGRRDAGCRATAADRHRAGRAAGGGDRGPRGLEPPEPGADHRRRRGVSSRRGGCAADPGRPTPADRGAALAAVVQARRHLRLPVGPCRPPGRARIRDANADHPLAMTSSRPQSVHHAADRPRRRRWRPSRSSRRSPGVERAIRGSPWTLGHGLQRALTRA